MKLVPSAGVVNFEMNRVGDTACRPQKLVDFIYTYSVFHSLLKMLLTLREEHSICLRPKGDELVWCIEHHRGHMIFRSLPLV